MAITSTPTISDLPDDLVRAVVTDAERDADRVGLFLDSICNLRGTPGKPMVLPAGFLLDLGAALRLLAWECSGLCIHRDAGLPSAHEAIIATFERVTNSDGPKWGELSHRVLALTVEHFAWRAREELDADIILGTPEDDALLDALAEFLWAHRHLGCASTDS